MRIYVALNKKLVFLNENAMSKILRYRGRCEAAQCMVPSDRFC